MKKVFSIVLPLAVALLAAPAVADDWFVQLEGAGQGFAALQSGPGGIDYNIITSGLGTVTGATIDGQNIGANFEFGAASGSTNASASEGSSLVVTGSNGSVQGSVVFVAAGDGGGGEPGDGLDDDTTDPCVPGPNTACLRDGRFEITASYEFANGDTGTMGADNTTDDTAQLFFLNPNNVEVFVKVLDACGINENYWVFLAGLTDQGVSLKVRDSQAGKSRTFANPVGTVFVTVTGTTAELGAFPTCP